MTPLEPRQRLGKADKAAEVPSRGTGGAVPPQSFPMVVAGTQQAGGAKERLQVRWGLLKS